MVRKTELIDNVAEIGALVKTRRKASGLRQAEAAALCKVGVRFISDLENGKDTLHVGKVLHVLKAFGLQIALNERGVPHG